MTDDQFKERLDLLLSLSEEHPSYIKYSDRYTSYLEEHQMEFKLPGASRTNKELEEAIHELNVIKHSESVQLTRLSLSTYLFARTIAEEFLQAVRPKHFFNIKSTSLMFDNRFYKQKLASFLNILKSSSDKAAVYVMFRKALVIYLINNILKPEDVLPYAKLVDFMETEIDKTNQILALIDVPEEAIIMDHFGASYSIYEPGEVTKEVILNLMNGGAQYLSKLGETNQIIKHNLLNLSKAELGEILQDFLYGVDLVYCRTREEILAEQKLAQSILNIYSTDLLLKTALSTANERRELSVSNLKLLQTHGIISTETLLKYEEKLKNEN